MQGGPTLFADSLGAGGRLSEGMMVGAVRGRLLCFSSGPENVHAGLPNTAGAQHASVALSSLACYSVSRSAVGSAVDPRRREAGLCLPTQPAVLSCSVYL